MERNRHQQQQQQQQQQQRTDHNPDPNAMSPGTEFISFLTQALGVLLEVAAHALFLGLNLAWALVDSFVEVVLPTRKTFEGQAALVVGAGGGVGREAALLLGKRGVRVICWDTDTMAVRETVRQIRVGGGEAYHYTVDVTRRSEVEVAAHIARVDVQDITLLVNPGPVNAPPPEAPLLNVYADDAAAFLGRTLLTHVWLLQVLLPQMQHAGAGHVVALLPAEAVRGAEGAALTGAHGGGVRALTEALRADVTLLGRKADINFTNVYALGVRPDADDKTQTAGSVTAKEAAKAMLEAAESNYKEVSLPRALLPIANITRVLPQPVVDLAKDLIYPPPEKPRGARAPPPRRRFISDVEQLYSK